MKKREPQNKIYRLVTCQKCGVTVACAVDGTHKCRCAGCATDGLDITVAKYDKYMPPWAK